MMCDFPFQLYENLNFHYSKEMIISYMLMVSITRPTRKCIVMCTNGMCKCIVLCKYCLVLGYNERHEIANLFDRWLLPCGLVVSTAFAVDVGAVLSSIFLVRENYMNVH